MMRRMVAGFLAALLMLVAVQPAFAAEVNQYERGAHDEFKTVVEKYRSVLHDDVADQYLTEAETALLAVDLDKAACEEFTEVVHDLDKLYSDNNVQSRPDLHRLLTESLRRVNKVANKYGMNVTVDSDWYAHVSVTKADGTTTVVAETSPVVKQTGSGISGMAVAAVLGAIAATVLTLRFSARSLQGAE